MLASGGTETSEEQGKRTRGVRNHSAESCKARLKEILPLPQIPQTVGIDVKETLRGWPNFLPSWSWRELLARKSRAPMDSGLAE